MARAAAGVNPRILRWARESAGYAVEDVASAFNKSPEVIQAWECGRALPTYVQLEKLASKLYGRPIALFFFPEIPEETEPIHSFRTLPATELDAFSADTRLALSSDYSPNTDS